MLEIAGEEEMVDLQSLLKITIEEEFRATPSTGSRIDTVLKSVLVKWGKSNFVTFTNAFAIENEKIVHAVFNPDTNSNEPLNQVFNKLIEPPPIDKGKWPWNILRAQGTGEEGLVKPVCLVLSKDDGCKESQQSNDCYDEFCFCINDNELPTTPESIYKSWPKEHNKDMLKTISWKWYAAFPTLLGDKSRNDSKKTAIAVYILGTRREFHNRPTKDYGLIVGFTEDVMDKKEEAIRIILASWNIMAVAPHIIEDGRHISELEAVRSMSHTLHTFVATDIRPKIENELRDNKNVPGILDRLTNVTRMLGFVARGGCEAVDDRGLRWEDINPQEYNLVAKIGDIFKQYLSRLADINLECGNGKKVGGRWVNKDYLEAALLEIIRNIHNIWGKLKDDQKKVSISFDLFDSKLTCCVTNSVDSCDDDSNNASPVSGMDALKVFMRAVGGTLDTQCDKNKMVHKTKLVFDTKKWNDAVEELGQSEKPGKEPERRDSTADISINDCAPIPELANIAFRVLVVDDQVYAEDMLLDLQGNSDGWCKYPRNYEDDSGNPINFEAVYHSKHRIEIMFSPSVLWARDFLLKDHFDIYLLDIDFKYDPESKKGKVPSLGGFLLAIAVTYKKHSVTSLFTAMNDDLLRDNNYKYLKELKDKGFLEPSFEIVNKNLKDNLQKAFERWIEKVLPSLDPDKGDLNKLAYDFEYNQCLKLKNDRVASISSSHTNLSNDIPFSLFNFLVKDKKATQGFLFSQICGHALVNHLFTRILHYNSANEQQREAFKQCLVKKTKNSNYRTAYHDFKEACSIFGLDENAEKKFIDSLPVKDVNNKPMPFRYKFCDPHYVYFLADKSAEDYWKDCLAKIREVVIDTKKLKSAPKELCIESSEKGLYIYFDFFAPGHKEGCNFCHKTQAAVIKSDSTRGGSAKDLKKYLEPIGVDVLIRGPDGALSLKSDKPITDSDTEKSLCTSVRLVLAKGSTT